MNPWDQFTGANAGYVYELFERYQRDPSSVDESTRRAFATWTPAFAQDDSAQLRRAPIRSAFTIRLATRRSIRCRTA